MVRKLQAYLIFILFEDESYKINSLIKESSHVLNITKRNTPWKWLSIR